MSNEHLSSASGPQHGTLQSRGNVEELEAMICEAINISSQSLLQGIPLSHLPSQFEKIHAAPFLSTLARFGWKPQAELKEILASISGVEIVGSKGSIEHVRTTHFREKAEKVQSTMISILEASTDGRILLSQIPSYFSDENCTLEDRNNFQQLLRNNKLKKVLQEMPSLEVVAGSAPGYETVCRTGADHSAGAATSQKPPDEAAQAEPIRQAGLAPAPFAASAAASLSTPTSAAVQTPASAAAQALPLKMKDKILTMLSRYPQGCTCSQLVKESKLGYFVGSQAQLLGVTGPLSPAAVLSQIPEIRVEKRNSSVVYLLRASECTPQVDADQSALSESLSVKASDVCSAQQQTQINQTTAAESIFPTGQNPALSCDLRATMSTGQAKPEGLQGLESIPLTFRPIACLRHLHSRRYSQSGWPTSRDKLKADIQATFSMQSLAAFLLALNDHHAATAESILKKSTKRILKFSVSHGCVQKKAGGKLQWDLGTTATVLASCYSEVDVSHLQFFPQSPRIVGLGEFEGSKTASGPTSAMPRTNVVPGSETAVVLVATASQLESAVAALKSATMQHSIAQTADDVHPRGPNVIACDCEGVPEELILIQVGVVGKTFIFDCLQLGARAVCSALAELLASESVITMFHDLHNDAAALATIGGLEHLRGTLDSQLAMEFLTGELLSGLNGMLEHFGCKTHSGKDEMKRQMRQASASTLFSQRPLAPAVVQYAAQDVSLLLAAGEHLLTALGEHVPALCEASDRRASRAMRSGGLRQIGFDVSSQYALASRELMEVTRPDDLWQCQLISLSDDAHQLFELLPDAMAADLRDCSAHLSDICLDKGRRPYAWVGGQRRFLGGEECSVQASEIASIVDRLGGFGSDNRAGLERQLHRVSGMRNRAGEVIGLTMRVGRHMRGNADMIVDLLLGREGSVLILGQPGCGKTTIVREIARMLSEQFNVCIVDTSNEIAGDGDVPHPCVGFARRMMVPSLNEQSSVMVQCVQNHTPDVMVIDEIGRVAEVEAARTCKQRGVRMIASAHGDLRRLLKNRELRGLVGGVETVTLGDAQAKLEGGKGAAAGVGSSKLKRVRGGEPTFDTIIELTRGQFHCWQVVKDVAGAVDAILEGRQYQVQHRIRDPQTGSVQLELEHA